MQRKRPKQVRVPRRYPMIGGGGKAKQNPARQPNNQKEYFIEGVGERTLLLLPLCQPNDAGRQDTE